MKLRMFRISSIKGKIIFLSFLGIMGMCFITGINSYLTSSMKKNAEIGALSQSIVRSILESSLIEKDFLSTGDQQLLEPHKKIHKQLAKDLTKVKSLVEGELVSLSENIAQIQDTNTKAFQSVVNIMKGLEGDREKYLSFLMTSKINLKKSVRPLKKKRHCSLSQIKL